MKSPIALAAIAVMAVFGMACAKAAESRTPTEAPSDPATEVKPLPSPPTQPLGLPTAETKQPPSAELKPATTTEDQPSDITRAAPAAKAASPAGRAVVQKRKPVAAAKSPGKTVPSPTRMGSEPPKVAKAAPKVFAGDTYLVTVQPPTATAGQAAVATVTVVPKKGWKLNEDFPTRLKVTPPAGVTLTKPMLRKADAVMFKPKMAKFAVKFTSSAGNKQFAGKLKLAVCTDKECVPKTQKLAWSVKVQ